VIGPRAEIDFHTLAVRRARVHFDPALAVAERRRSSSSVSTGTSCRCSPTAGSSFRSSRCPARRGRRGVRALAAGAKLGKIVLLA
jgi:hypothetical protein